MIFIDYLIFCALLFFLMCLLATYVEEKLTLETLGLCAILSIIPALNIIALGAFIWFSIETLFKDKGDTVLLRWPGSKKK